AFAMCSRPLRRRVGKSGFANWLGDWKGAACPLGRGLAGIRKLRPYLGIEVDDDANAVWERVASTDQALAPQSILAIVTISFAGRREERSLWVMEEAGELRVGQLS